MFIQTEATPNPATLKFLPGRTVLGEGTMEFRDRDTAGRSPLAEKLFAVQGVTGVFYGSDFVTVTKDESDWQHLKPAILGAIMEHHMPGAPPSPTQRGAGSREVLRRGGRGDGCNHQGPDRDACVLRSPRRRRHHLPRLLGRYRLSR
jgi:hypothetical protein